MPNDYTINFDDIDLPSFDTNVDNTIITPQVTEYRCGQCGMTHKYKNRFRDIQGSRFCLKCFDEYFKKCDECGRYHSAHYIKTINGKKYCNNCIRKLFYRCSDCSEWLLIRGSQEDRDFYDMGYGVVCVNCYRTNQTECIECGEMYYNRNGQFIRSDEFVCSDCYEEHYRPCRVCQRLYRVDDMTQDEHSGNWYCVHCQEYHSIIREYNFVPKTFPKYKKRYDNQLYMGWELELYNENDYFSKAKQLKKHLEDKKVGEYFMFKDDGSIKNNQGERCGFEVVSMPMTYGFMKDNISIKNLLNYFKFLKFSSYDNKKCGFHVHVSKRFFRPIEVDKIRFFFNNNYDTIYKFSKRNGTGQDYINKEHFTCSDLVKGKSSIGKYTSFRTDTNMKTVEFRIFRGTLNYERFKATLQFVDALCHYAKVMGINTDWDLFMDWVKTTNRYHILEKYIKDKGIVKHYSTADMVHLKKQDFGYQFTQEEENGEDYIEDDEDNGMPLNLNEDVSNWLEQRLHQVGNRNNGYTNWTTSSSENINFNYISSTDEEVA